MNAIVNKTRSNEYERFEMIQFNVVHVVMFVNYIFFLHLNTSTNADVDRSKTTAFLWHQNLIISTEVGSLLRNASLGSVDQYCEDNIHLAITSGKQPFPKRNIPKTKVPLSVIGLDQNNSFVDCDHILMG
jgi:hypothetical protein